MVMDEEKKNNKRKVMTQQKYFLLLPSVMPLLLQFIQLHQLQIMCSTV